MSFFKLIFVFKPCDRADFEEILNHEWIRNQVTKESVIYYANNFKSQTYT